MKTLSNANCCRIIEMAFKMTTKKNRRFFINGYCDKTFGVITYNGL